ncbi:hypothetical protein K488DRAFT_86988 [Vararia minispora EC-137]|uniref:Uncharacterized protein n=1 Tax=Vararia minispora EC-137 TaxID=1314806 RepID=A0ACB8QHT3_9AGAM|nr:hypothetical protein K488DRAFT_86988 [Vararia minispora EC-137]
MRIPASSSLLLAGLAVSSSSSSLSAMAAPTGEFSSSTAPINDTMTATPAPSAPSTFTPSQSIPSMTDAPGSAATPMENAFPTATTTTMTSTITSTVTVTATPTMAGDQGPASATKTVDGHSPNVSETPVAAPPLRSRFAYGQRLADRDLESLNLADAVDGLPIIGPIAANLLTALGLGPSPGESAKDIVKDPAQAQAIIDAAIGPMHDAVMAAVGKEVSAATGALNGAPVVVPVSPLPIVSSIAGSPPLPTPPVQSPPPATQGRMARRAPPPIYYRQEVTMSPSMMSGSSSTPTSTMPETESPLPSPWSPNPTSNTTTTVTETMTATMSDPAPSSTPVVMDVSGAPTTPVMKSPSSAEASSTTKPTSSTVNMPSAPAMSPTMPPNPPNSPVSQ